MAASSFVTREEDVDLPGEGEDLVPRFPGLMGAKGDDRSLAGGPEGAQ